MECCYLRDVQELSAVGNTPYARRFGELFSGPIIPFGAKVEYHPISTKDHASFSLRRGDGKMAALKIVMDRCSMTLPNSVLSVG